MGFFCLCDAWRQLSTSTPSSSAPKHPLRCIFCSPPLHSVPSSAPLRSIIHSVAAVRIHLHPGISRPYTPVVLTAPPCSLLVQKHGLRLPSLAIIGSRDFACPRNELLPRRRVDLFQGELFASGHFEKRTRPYHMPRGPSLRTTKGTGFHSSPADLLQELATPLRVSRQ